MSFLDKARDVPVPSPVPGPGEILGERRDFGGDRETEGWGLKGAWPRGGAAGAAAIIAVIAQLALLLAPASAAPANFCLTSGSGAGQCSNAQEVAADFETGNVFVADRGNNRIDVFDQSGAFIRAFGWDVIPSGGAGDTGAGLESCTTASTCKAGSEGAGAGQLSKPTRVAVDNVAASGSLHDVYVFENSRVQKFTPTGEVLAFTSAPKGSGPCEFNNSADPIAVGPAGNVFVADSIVDGSHRVQKFGPAGGACLKETVLLNGNFLLRTLAVDSAEDAYVSVGGAGRGAAQIRPRRGGNETV